MDERSKLVFYDESKSIGFELRIITLSRTELYMLRKLNINFGQPVSRDRLFDGFTSLRSHEIRVVDSHMARLRAKLIELTDKKLEIKSVRGFGYKLCGWKSKLN